MYRLTDSIDVVTRVSDGAVVPRGHRWWVEYQDWLYAGNTPEPAESKSPEQLAKDTQNGLAQVLNDHLNAVAAQRRYDSRFTCALRAGFPGPFQAEGSAFAAWMDQCNLMGYTIMAEVKSGTRSIPTAEELISAMPVIEWPPSPTPDGAA